MLQKFILLGLLGLVVPQAQAHSQHVHSHGVGKLDIAFEHTKGEVDFKISADALLGRETRPKTDAERLADANLIMKIKNNWDKMIVFPASHNCKSTKLETKIDYEVDNSKAHADVEVDADVSCTTPLSQGAKIQVLLIESFPKIQRIDTQIVTDQVQKAENITQKVQSITL